MPVRIDIRELAGRDALAAARVLAGAFMADAIWAATGPRAAWHRRIVLTTLYLAELATAFLRRGIVLGGFHGARLDGVLIAYRDGERPVPWWAWLLRAVPCLLAGPVALVRALRVVSGLDALHPREPHVFYYLLGRRAGAVGAGYALCHAAFAVAGDRPGYVETTADPDLVAMNELLGWVRRDTYPLPTGRVITTMWREP